MSPVLLFFLTLVFIADGLMVFLIPVLVYAETQSLTYSGLSYMLWWLPRIVLTPVLGVLIDRLGVRPVSIASDAIKAFGCLLLCLVLNFAEQPLILALTCGLLGAGVSIGNAQTITAVEKLIAAYSRHIDRDANLLTRLDLLGMVLGPLVGMLLYEYGFLTLLYIAATLYLCNAYYFLTSRLFNFTPDFSPKNKIRPPNSEKTKLFPLLIILKNPFIILMIALALGNNMFDGLVESSGAALIENNMGLSVKYFGFIEICAGVAGFLSTLIYGAALNRLSREALLTIGLGLIVIASLLLTTTLNQLGPFLTFYALGIAGKVFTGNIMRTLRLTLIPYEHLASTSSLILTLNQSVLPLMGVFLFLSDHYDWPLTRFMYIAIALSLLAGIGLLIGLRRRLAPSRADAPSPSCE
ncbi:major facilitator superfamily MFS_1 [Dickeya chrysanthemi Ech1591]|uniref:Major facilitator superfamily MFS_1 n=1 Tax=Dickeya chrysanthemi (strain Ech1591) TaxID=561229 RepID=C6CKR0_DICC1|nr:MFS transporter [Dickeya chrysanthemi]ACT08424.1 major facilitator superfamily MFS_1 [Dickeya chrysanthemi Ech1591]